MRKFPDRDGWQRQTSAAGVVNPCARIGAALPALFLGTLVALSGSGCDRAANPVPTVTGCAVAAGGTPAFSPALGCLDDYRALAARPYDQSIPGAYAVKTVIDRADGDRLYFLNTREYFVHYEFVSERLSGGGKPLVPSMTEFSLKEYYTPDRRFILGTLAYYEKPGIWAWELTPSDNAGADLIASAFRRIAEACFCGEDLRFHATSLAIQAEAAGLPATVKVIATADLYKGVDYQALNYATGFGRLVFAAAGSLGDHPPEARDIVVADAVPDRLPMVSGLITRDFQLPLSHANLLAAERRIPNMALRGALADTALRALEGKWVRLEVGPFGYAAAEATRAEADAWWEARLPAATAPVLDTAAKELLSADGMLDPGLPDLGEALKKAAAAYGGKAAHYAALARMDGSKVHYGKAVGIPVSHYLRHMRENGLFDSLDRMLADSAFNALPAERERRLAGLRAAIMAAPVDAGFGERLKAGLDAEFPGIESLRFRPSGNDGDVDGYTGAGLYGSSLGGGNEASRVAAVREVWAGVWDFRAFEERRYRGIDHKEVGMGVLVQAAQEGRAATGTALTANPFDPANTEPGFYVNARPGGASVTRPGPAPAADEFIYHFDITGQPIVLIAKADSAPGAAPVLTEAQTYALGQALKEIHTAFQPLYGYDPSHWFAMEVDFTLGRLPGDPGAAPGILIDRVRRCRGWGRP